MGLCIPMVFVTKDATLPIWVAGASGVGILAVWLFGKPAPPKMEEQKKMITELQSTVEDLKERLENVEVMNRYESVLAEKALDSESGDGRSMGNPANQETA